MRYLFKDQPTWDQFNQSLANLFGMEYTPSPMPLDQYENQSINGFTETNNIQLKPWCITKPDGSTLVCNNLAKFCRENNLVQNKMRAVAKGVKKSHRGHKVVEV